ncbi:diaminopimelate epimerase [Halpernia frigidisoli]|uniref:Diaminopimelate epimerase n=1 Tax=Halpernia frigidisoli TaxID=1125876 RepID=A0A1I3E239_9FLAO|nr:diaminopimelate epimerase [Halpernia frigidisoli]SFH92898.1 diaminopimelate epimerase [Halpernia frigidisoli]
MEFYKYQATGNDFIIIDNRDQQFLKDEKIIENLCDRRFGIGADGLILLEEHDTLDFKMVYYNSDGKGESMCGNGGRCIVAFAHFLDLFEDHTKFEAIDGDHQAEIINGIVKLKMIDVNEIFTDEDDFVINTGSPHYIKFTEDLEHFNVFNEGSKIRNSEKYHEQGINVNFVQILAADSLYVRTYERGVENETYSCGTGVTAAALPFINENKKIMVKTIGGNLTVYAEKVEKSFVNIWLEGPAKQVFKGKISI